MASKYYLSWDRGSDSTGTGTATNPWKTPYKAIDQQAAALSGLTQVYFEPGVYYGGAWVNLTPDASNRLELIGDVDGSNFLAGGYATPKTGVVEWSGWADDATFSTSVILNNPSGKSYVTVKNIKFMGGNNAVASCISSTGGTNWTVQDCIAFGPHQYGQAAFRFVGPTAGGPMNLTIERCDVYAGPAGGSAAIDVRIYEQAAEYDAAVTVRNCLLFGTSSSNGYGFSLSIAGGTGGKPAYGVTVEYCTNLAGRGFRFYEGVTTKPLATPNVLRGCAVLLGIRGVTSGDTTHVAENYNLFHAETPRTNTSSGANSLVNYRPAFNLSDGRSFGVTATRPYLTPDDVAYLKIPSGAIPKPTGDRYGRTRNADTALGAVEIGYDAATAAVLVNGGLVR